MPYYDYICSNCGYKFETLQKMTDPPLKECPSCHSCSYLVKQIGKGGFIVFNGSGFYDNDYRKAGNDDY